MDNGIVEGGCFCGSIRFSFELNSYPSANCHCSMCRRISGAAFVSWMAIPLSCFEYTKGEPKELISSSHGARFFCQECGTPIACILDADKRNMNITICSLDKPQDFEPRGDIHVEDMLDWVKS